MSLEKVKEYFKAYGIEDRIIELSESSATVELAAHALHTEPCRIATAGNVKIDNAKYRHTFGAKAKMLTADQAAELIGHAVGGVCPFAVNDGVAVYLDESLNKYETVFPACGSSNSAIELTIPELEKCSGYEKWVDVTKASC